MSLLNSPTAPIVTYEHIFHNFEVFLSFGNIHSMFALFDMFD